MLTQPGERVTHMAGQDSFPDVFDRIADTARPIQAEQDTLRPADPEAIASREAAKRLVDLAINVAIEEVLG